MSTVVELYEHGPDTDESDYRIHVCTGEGAIYLMKTQAVLGALGGRRQAMAGQLGVTGVTSRGKLLPVTSIPDIRRIQIPQDIQERIPISTEDTTSERGRKAEDIVRLMSNRALIPLPIQLIRQNDPGKQRHGHDFYTLCQWIIQVKCDCNGGLNGTGNLYIETAERNPKRAR